MANWFIIDADKKITNIIAADSKELAETLTGLTAIEADGTVGGGIGYVWVEEKGNFKPPFPPHVGWIFDEELWRYEPPVAIPDEENRYIWDDSTVSWVLYEEPAE